MSEKQSMPIFDGSGSPALPRKPEWLKRPMAHNGRQRQVIENLTACGLHTVCAEAKCPNRGECFSRGTATFLVMGRVCTRRCAFCGIAKGSVEPLDMTEIDRVVSSIRSMKIRHAVITSVTRDDLPDGGARFFAQMVAALRRELPGVTAELLIPDFQGDPEALSVVFDSRPDILNHNVETVPSLYCRVRPQADYERSLCLLRSANSAGLRAKSGLMVGLGESFEEVCKVLDDLESCGCRVVTIGQYLQPSPHQVPVESYVAPERFRGYAMYGERHGLMRVVAGPFVRSSYRAAEILEEISG